LRVSQIADAVGFYDADYFSRRFRQVTGSSPAHFRTEKSRSLTAP
jgi:AraC-like DNA-binding protein